MSDQLPHSEKAEQAALGAVFIKPIVLSALRSELKTDDFFFPVHREIFDAMIAVESRNQAVDYIAVSDELKTRGMLPRLKGGESYLIEMAGVTPTAENVTHYARLVAQKAMLRRMIATSAEIASSARGEIANADEFAADAVGRLSSIAVRSTAAGENLEETAKALFYELDRAERGEGVPRVKTGIERLDAKLGGGLRNQELVVPAALTSIGKTSLAMQIAIRGAAERKVPALVFSLEMSRKTLAAKAAALLMRCDTGEFSYDGDPVDWTNRVNPGLRAVAALKDLVRIEEHRNIGNIVMVASAWRAKNPGPAIVVVDYLQKVSGFRVRDQNREQEIAGVASALKDLAKDLDLPVIAPAQLDNDAAKEKRAPRIGDLRGSKAIEMEADVIIGIHRDRLAARGIAELILLKNRNGAIGKVRTTWVGAYQAFENLEEEDQHGDD